MKKISSVVIIGSGASGLSVAWELARKNKDIRIQILESDNDIGGLSKTIEHNGLRFDIGPHRFSPQLPEVLNRVRELLGSDLVSKKNIHSVYYKGMLYEYPPSIKDFFKILSLRNSMAFGLSWIKARAQNILTNSLKLNKNESFEEILIRNFGRKFYQEVIFPMIYKVWGTKHLHPEFAKIRFIEPTFGRILRKILFKNTAMYTDVFYYPVKGYSEIWKSIRQAIEKNNCSLELGAGIDCIEASSLKGPFKVVYTHNGAKKTIDADLIVSTISNKSLINYLSKTNLVNELLDKIDSFQSRTLRLGVLAVRGFKLKSRVVIFPEADFIFNRVSEMNQFADLGYDNDTSILLVDVICGAGSGYDTMEEADFNNLLLEALLKLKWFKGTDVTKIFSLRFPEAYPVLSRERYDAQEAVDRHFNGTGIILCGREASSDYNNAHNAMSKGFFAARYILGEISFSEYENFSKALGRLPIQD